ncbi:FliH/SctL family protein, partial [candidate division KSB1 bacterium]
IEEQITKVLGYVISEGKLSFHVNPEDSAVFEKKEEFVPEEYLDRIVIVPDETIERGGCKLQTNSGTIDATISAQLDELEAAVIDGLESESESDTGKDIGEVQSSGSDQPESKTEGPD